MEKPRKITVQLSVAAMLISVASFYAHELGHYLTALALGYEDPRLTPVMVVMPELIDQTDEIVVALAGPVSSAIVCLIAAILSRKLRSPVSRTLASFAALLNGIVVTSVAMAAFVPGTDGNRLLHPLGWPALAAATGIGILVYWNLWRIVPWHDGGKKTRWLLFLTYSFSLGVASLIAGNLAVLLLILPGISLLTIGFVDPGTYG
jgi:hypothetical protein